MAVDIKFLIDGADRGQPTNADDFGVSISEDSKINMRIVSFDNDLVFVGGTFEYIYNNLIDTGGCSLITVEVQYLCAGIWKRLTNGYIIVSECTFDLDKCSVSTKLYDDSFSTKINNNKSIPFFSDSNITKNLQPIVPPTVYYVNLFNPANNVYETSSNTGFITIYDALKHLIGCMSDNLVGFESDFFSNQIDAFGYGKTLMVSNGRAIRTDTSVNTNLIFEQLYEALNKKIRLGMVVERQANGLPLLRIENYDYFQQLNANVNLYDQPGIKFNYDTTQLYASVDFGANPFLNDFECGDDTQRCSFIQTTFRGFREETFGVLGECNTSNTLDLASKDIIFDTNVIENIYRFGSEDYDTDVVLIDSDWFGFANPIYAAQGDPLGVGGHVYNSDYINEEVAVNWLGGYPNSLYQYLQGFNPADTGFRAEILDTLDPDQKFDVGHLDDGYQCFSTMVGNHINFTQEISDNGNNFSVDKYIIPYDGIYTFNAQVVKDQRFYTPDYIAGFYVKIQRYATDDTTLIQEFISLPPTIQTINSTQPSFVSVINLPCIAGDIIKVDYCGLITVNNEIPYFARIAKNNLAGDKTFFEGFGRPFDRTELVPVDPNTIRRLLYKFDRPLRMEEIENILDNSSRPIKFGQFDDPLRVIEGYINKVDIKSIIKQDASITLKSNKILR
jgi:hypothetical protein